MVLPDFFDGVASGMTETIDVQLCMHYLENRKKNYTLLGSMKTGSLYFCNCDWFQSFYSTS